MSQLAEYLNLTRIQRIYVDSRLAGMSQIAAATASGAANPRTEAHRLEKNENVQKALIARMSETADSVDFGRKDAHNMYMDAYNNADTATEQIAAVNAMVKLHGLEVPKEIVVKHTHNHSGQIEHMATDELMKLAGLKEALTLEGEYEIVGDKPLLAPPELTEENVEEPKTVPRVRDDY